MDRPQSDSYVTLGLLPVKGISYAEQVKGSKSFKSTCQDSNGKSWTIMSAIKETLWRKFKIAEPPSIQEWQFSSISGSAGQEIGLNKCVLEPLAVYETPNTKVFWGVHQATGTNQKAANKTKPLLSSDLLYRRVQDLIPLPLSSHPFPCLFD